MASDALDTVVSLASVRSIGRRDSWSAAGLALVFTLGDLRALRTVAPDPAPAPAPAPKSRTRRTMEMWGIPASTNYSPTGTKPSPR